MPQLISLAMQELATQARNSEHIRGANVSLAWHYRIMIDRRVEHLVLSLPREIRDWFDEAV